ncbi:hypothetical protein Patl1_34596 [Pistacia atlantica]|uniref:Uncharacterized protein n=1 Tax=Pistacia atlantica TaxID=434234 RepID=A0ACC0ZVW5_9ROSI|nr:hypothetical protein Patl1_34596 [Pistacia atlantica]
MTGGNAFSPGDQALSPNPNLEIMIEEGSQNSDHLLEDEGNDLEIEDSDLGIDGNDLDLEGDDLDIEGNELEIESDGLEIESNDFENDSKQILETGNHCHENDGDDRTALNGQSDVSQANEYPPPVVGMEFESYDDAYNYYNCYAKELGFAIRVKSSWTKRNSKEKRGAVLCCNCEGFKTIKEANSRRKETRTGCLAMIRLRLVESNRWRVDEVKLEHNHLFDPERAQNSKSHKKMEAGSKRKVEPTVDVEVRTIKLYRTPVLDSVGSGSSNSNVHATGPIATYVVKERESEGNMTNVRNIEVMYDKAGAEVRCICSCFNFNGYLCRHALCILNYNGMEEIPFQYILQRWRKDFKRPYVPYLGSNNVDINNPVQWFDHLYKRAMQVVGEGMISQDHYMVAWQAFKESLNKMEEAPLSCEQVPEAVGMEFESYDDAYNYYNCYAKEVGFRVRVKNSWFKRNSREKYGAVLCCSSQGFKRIKDVNRLRKETRTGCPAMIRMRLVDSKRWRILEVTLEHNHILGAKVYRSIKKMGAGTKRKSQSSSDAEGRTIKLHALCVLNFNGVEEIPSKYILSRWKKDYKRLYIPDHVSNNVDATDRVLWFNQLYKSALQVVEEGVISLDHYKVALQAFEESLNRVHDVEEKQE